MNQKSKYFEIFFGLENDYIGHGWMFQVSMSKIVWITTKKWTKIVIFRWNYYQK